MRPMCFELCPSQGSSCNTKLGTFKKDEYQKKKKRNPFVSCSSCNLQMLLYANICSVYKQGLSRWLLLLSKCLLSVQLGVNIFLALVVGAIFFGVKDDQSGIQNRWENGWHTHTLHVFLKASLFHSRYCSCGPILTYLLCTEGRSCKRTMRLWPLYFFWEFVSSRNLFFSQLNILKFFRIIKK